MSNTPEKVAGPEPVPGFEGLRAARLADVVEPMMARVQLAAEFPDADIRPSGIEELDRVIRFQPGRLSVLGGREGAGKSALALQIARWWAGQGAALYVLTEMSLEEVVERLVASTAHIPLWQVQKSPTPEQQATIREALVWLIKNSDLTIVEAQGQSVGDLVNRIRTFAAKQGVPPRGVVIDNLWGLSGASGVKGDNGEVSRGMGEIARQLATLTLPWKSGGVDAPVMLLHHLNREATKGLPATAMLGGSDQIGYWASQVLLVDQRKVLVPSDEFTTTGTTHELHVTKNRGGKAGISIPLEFIGEQMRFAGAGPMKPFDKPSTTDITVETTYRRRLQELPHL